MTALSKQPIDCAGCGRQIAARRFHGMTGDGLPGVYCIRCMGQSGMHARLYPDCPVSWHDCWDHPVKFCTRAAAHLLLNGGVVPEWAKP